MERIQQVLVEKATTLGIAWKLLTAYGSQVLLLSYQGQEVLFRVDGVPWDQWSLQAHFTAGNEQYSKRLLAQLEIPHPKSLVFRDVMVEEAWLQAVLDGTKGKGVQLHCCTFTDVAVSVRDSQARCGVRDFMLEEQILGTDLRLQAVGGRLVAARLRHHRDHSFNLCTVDRAIGPSPPTTYFCLGGFDHRLYGRTYCWQCTWALELNGESYWLHHTFSEGRTHDMAALI